MDYLFTNLVLKNISIAQLFKRQSSSSFPIRMRGIVLESPKCKVHLKSLMDFVFIGEDTLVQQQQSVKSRNNESRETLKPDLSDSQYVAVPVSNIELQARNQNSSELADDKRSMMRSALSKTNTSSTIVFGGSGSLPDHSSSQLPKSLSRQLKPPPISPIKRSQVL